MTPGGAGVVGRRGSGSGRRHQFDPVRPLVNGRYKIVNGEHNVMAARRAGLAEVRCEVQEMDDGDGRHGGDAGDGGPPQERDVEQEHSIAFLLGG